MIFRTIMGVITDNAQCGSPSTHSTPGQMNGDKSTQLSALYNSLSIEDRASWEILSRAYKARFEVVCGLYTELMEKRVGNVTLTKPKAYKTGSKSKASPKDKTAQRHSPYKNATSPKKQYPTPVSNPRPGRIELPAQTPPYQPAFDSPEAGSETSGTASPGVGYKALAPPVEIDEAVEYVPKAEPEDISILERGARDNYILRPLTPLPESEPLFRQIDYTQGRAFPSGQSINMGHVEAFQHGTSSLGYMPTPCIPSFCLGIGYTQGQGYYGTTSVTDTTGFDTMFTTGASVPSFASEEARNMVAEVFSRRDPANGSEHSDPSQVVKLESFEDYDNWFYGPSTEVEPMQVDSALEA